MVESKEKSKESLGSCLDVNQTLHFGRSAMGLGTTQRLYRAGWGVHCTGKRKRATNMVTGLTNGNGKKRRGLRDAIEAINQRIKKPSKIKEGVKVAPALHHLTG